MYVLVKRYLLPIILIFAIVIRVLMINYGLPLWLYNDEPPFVLATLKMLQLKTLIPNLFQEEFRSFLYYPIYISYIYMPFFLAYIGIITINLNVSIIEVQQILMSDISSFFIIARTITIILSIWSIYLTYTITKRITSDSNSALISAFFIASSVLHIILSVTSKQWLPILFALTLILYCLSHPDWSIRKRYVLAAIIIGIGTGISVIIISFSFFIFLWYIFYDRNSILSIISTPFIYLLSLVILCLSIIPELIYSPSLGFIVDTTITNSKSILGFITNIILFPSSLILTEPILFLFFCIGAFYGIIRREPFFKSTIIFFIFYSSIFYIFFRTEHRFLSPYIPLLAIGAGYGFYELKKCIKSNYYQMIVSLTVLILVTIAIKIGILGYNNDSRTQAINWVDKNVAQNTKVLVYANLTRLPSTNSAISEQSKIDPSSLRSVDRAEALISQKYRSRKTFHALNLYSVKNPIFFQNIFEYARVNKYSYIIISKHDFNNEPLQFNSLRKLAQSGKLLATFGNSYNEYSLTKSEIGPTLIPLFKINEFGVEIEIYKLPFK